MRILCNVSASTGKAIGRLRLGWGALWERWVDLGCLARLGERENQEQGTIAIFFLSFIPSHEIYNK